MNAIAKGVISVLAIFIAINTSVAQVKTTTVEFDSYAYNFGKIEESAGKVTHTFTFKNSGSYPFVINAINVTCGCTTPVWDKAPLMPGKVGKITVTFDPEGRPGVFNNPITVIGNVEELRIRLSIKGLVNARARSISEDFPFHIGDGLRLAQRSVVLGNVARGTVVTSTLGIANGSDKAIKVDVNRSTLPSYIDVRAAKATLAAGERSEIIVKIDATKTDKWGEVEFYYGLIVNGSKLDSQVANRAILIEDFSRMTKEQLRNAPNSNYSSYFYHFSDCARGTKLEKEFYISNSGRDDLIIRYLDFDAGKLTVKTDLSTIKSGQTATVTISLKNTDIEGRIGQSVNIITNDPTNPVRDIRVMATIK